MARQIKTIDYDSDNDILFISNGDKVKSSLDIGDFILDVNHNNLICGMEIMEASKRLGVNKIFLEHIQSMKMSVTYRTSNVYVLLMISFKKEGNDVNIPIPLTLDLGHKIPREELLVYNQ